MKLQKLIQNQKGQGIMEYMILTSLIGVITLVTIKNFGSVVNERIEKMKQKIVKTIDIK